MRSLISICLSMLSLGILSFGAQASELNESCKKFVADLPPDMFWKQIAVPENPSVLEGPKIEIFFYGRMTEGKIPTLFFNGGPGEDSHNSLTVYEKARKLHPDTADVDFIYMDQRGTGCSSHFPTELTVDSARRLLLYGSREIVADAEEIRRSLIGDQTWNVYGASYGGNMVSRYIILHPEAIHSAYSFGQPNIDPLEWYRIRSLRQQDAWKIFLRSYPEDGAIFNKLQAAIPQSHCVSAHNVTLCGNAGLDGFVFHLAFQYWARIHNDIHKMVNSDGTVNLEEYDKFTNKIAIEIFVGEGLPQQILSWKDMQNGMTDFEIGQATTLALAQEGVDVNKWPITELRLLKALKQPLMEEVVDQLRKSDVDLIQYSDLLQALQTHPSLEYYIITGESDALSPSEIIERTATELRQTLGDQVKYEMIKGAGHEGQESLDILRSLQESSRRP